MSDFNFQDWRNERYNIDDLPVQRKTEDELAADERLREKYRKRREEDQQRAEERRAEREREDEEAKQRREAAKPTPKTGEIAKDLIERRYKRTQTTLDDVLGGK